MKLVAGPVTEQVTWEVWREFVGREAQDAMIAGGMTVGDALSFLRECRRDSVDLPALKFYRVKVTSRRQRVDE